MIIIMNVPILCSEVVRLVLRLRPLCMEGRHMYISMWFNVIMIGMGGPNKGISNGLGDEKISL